MVFLGALREGALVAGPRKPVVPPLPNRIDFKGGWEVMGVATIFTNKQGPQVHMHSALGKGKKVHVGCVREKTNVFIVLEAVVLELKGVKATKDIDPVRYKSLKVILELSAVEEQRSFLMKEIQFDFNNLFSLNVGFEHGVDTKK